MGYEQVIIKAVDVGVAYNQSAASVEIMSGIFGIILFVLIIWLIWKWVRGSVVRKEYRDAYYIAKLRKHSEKSNVELEEAYDEINETPLFFKSKRKTDRERAMSYSDVTDTDLLFKALEEHEFEEKPAKAKKQKKGGK